MWKLTILSAIILNLIGGVAIAAQKAGSNEVELSSSVGGTFSGTITDEATSLPIADAGIEVFNSIGDWVAWAEADNTGQYTTQELPPGDYFARVYNWVGYINELFDNIDCATSCDETLGTPIGVASGTDTPGIDFALLEGGTISGAITSASSDLPVGDTGVDIYESDGTWAVWVEAESNGQYLTPSGLHSGSYFVVGHGGPNFIFELYDDIQCPPHGCDVTTGTPVGVTEGFETFGIDFVLLPVRIFSDDFESGDLGAWSFVRNADCDVMRNEVTNCDFDTEIGSWTLCNPGDVYHTTEDDSDGDTGSGAVEMVAVPDGTSMESCFNRVTSSGYAFMYSFYDMRLVSGQLDSCTTKFKSYSSADCLGWEGTIFGYPSPTSVWQTSGGGGRTVSDDSGNSFRLIFSCTGEGAVVRFNDIVLTTQVQ